MNRAVARLVRLIALLVFVFELQSQTTIEKDILVEAQKRYPMLRSCKPEGLGEEILCGSLQVFENRLNKSERKIPIDIYLFPSYSKNPDNQCYMDYAGGPGVPNTIFLNEYKKGAFTNEFRGYRDILLIDLRGTGASRLNCRAYDTLKVDTRTRFYNPKTAKDCFEELKDKADLSQYNTDNAVEDLNEVLKWLNVSQLDFCGGSYGTRIGIEWARRFPDRVGSLILLGTVPPEFGLANFADEEIEKQLQKLSERCEEDESCDNRFPEFPQNMYRLAQRLDEKPIQYDFRAKNDEAPISLKIDGNHFRSMIAQQFAGGHQLNLIPILVEEADKGNFGPLINKSIGSVIVHPVEWCQFCTEEPYTRFDSDYRDRTQQFFTKGIYAIEDTEVCKAWGIQPYPDWLTKELNLDMPILLITGENDVLTPPRMAEKIVEVTPNSRHIIFSNQGHFLNDWGCWKSIMLQFLNGRDLTELKADCSKDFQMASFTTDIKEIE